MKRIYSSACALNDKVDYKKSFNTCILNYIKQSLGYFIKFYSRDRSDKFKINISIDEMSRLSLKE